MLPKNVREFGKAEGMHERFVEITTAGGVMDAFITQPEENGAVSRGHRLHGHLGRTQRAL